MNVQDTPQDDRQTARSCPVCGVQKPRSFSEVEGQRFVRCGQCRSLYLASPPHAATLGEVYHSLEYQDARGHVNDGAVEAAKLATTTAYLKLLERYRPPGRCYLEVGCSAGSGLVAAAAAGWRVQGVEISPSAAAIAGQRPGVQAVYPGTVLDAPLALGSFDAVALFDVIEHIVAPHETLRRIYQLLRAEGLLLLVTPDGDGLSTKLMGSRWPHLFPEHVICFSRRGMRRALTEAGFEILRVGFAWKRVNLDMLIRHVRVHGQVFGGRALRLLAGVLPEFLTSALLPFNIGEFYAIARRPRILGPPVVGV